MDAKVGDLILIVSDAKERVVQQSLGQLRLHLAKELELLKDNDEFRFVWVTEFPLVSHNEEEDRWEAEHHPFTSPMDEDIHIS